MCVFPSHFEYGCSPPIEAPLATAARGGGGGEGTAARRDQSRSGPARGGGAGTAQARPREPNRGRGDSRPGKQSRGEGGVRKGQCAMTNHRHGGRAQLFPNEFDQYVLDDVLFVLSTSAAYGVQ